MLKWFLYDLVDVNLILNVKYMNIYLFDKKNGMRVELGCFFVLLILFCLY